MSDPRFDLSEFDRPGSSSAPSETGTDSRSEALHSRSASPSEEELAGEAGQREANKVLAPLSSAELEAYKKKEAKRGIIYISHIPHGMTVAKVRHLLEQFGPTERIYLHDPRADGESQSRKRHKGTAHFEEGWVEFSSKKVAKSVAALLNAQPLGAAAVTKSSMKARKNGPKGLKLSRRFTDEVWTMKYLPGFKWHMLTAQLSAERASRAARLRAELAQSQFEQTDYLRKVERARVVDEKKARKKVDVDPKLKDKDSQQEDKKKRSFSQREAVLRDVRDRPSSVENEAPKRKRSKVDRERSQALSSMLDTIF